MKIHYYNVIIFLSLLIIFLVTLYLGSRLIDVLFVYIKNNIVIFAIVEQSTISFVLGFIAGKLLKFDNFISFVALLILPVIAGVLEWFGLPGGSEQHITPPIAALFFVLAVQAIFLLFGAFIGKKKGDRYLGSE
jgi:hypothetical protein